jgi:hypothetical protein
VPRSVNAKDLPEIFGKTEEINKRSKFLLRVVETLTLGPGKNDKHTGIISDSNAANREALTNGFFYVNSENKTPVPVFSKIPKREYDKLRNEQREGTNLQEEAFYADVLWQSQRGILEYKNIAKFSLCQALSLANLVTILSKAGTVFEEGDERKWFDEFVCACKRERDAAAQQVIKCLYQVPTKNTFDNVYDVLAEVSDAVLKFWQSPQCVGPLQRDVFAFPGGVELLEPYAYADDHGNVKLFALNSTGARADGGTTSTKLAQLAKLVKSTTTSAERVGNTGNTSKHDFIVTIGSYKQITLRDGNFNAIQADVKIGDDVVCVKRFVDGDIHINNVEDGQIVYDGNSMGMKGIYGKVMVQDGEHLALVWRKEKIEFYINLNTGKCVQQAQKPQVWSKTLLTPGLVGQTVQGQTITKLVKGKKQFDYYCNTVKLKKIEDDLPGHALWTIPVISTGAGLISPRSEKLNFKAKGEKSEFADELVQTEKKLTAALVKNIGFDIFKEFLANRVAPIFDFLDKFKNNFVNPTATNCTFKNSPLEIYAPKMEVIRAAIYNHKATPSVVFCNRVRGGGVAHLAWYILRHMRKGKTNDEFNKAVADFGQIAAVSGSGSNEKGYKTNDFYKLLNDNSGSFEDAFGDICAALNQTNQQFKEGLTVQKKGFKSYTNNAKNEFLQYVVTTIGDTTISVPYTSYWNWDALQKRWRTRVLIVQTEVGATGINLLNTSRAHFLAPSSNFVQTVQAIGRIARSTNGVEMTLDYKGAKSNEKQIKYGFWEHSWKIENGKVERPSVHTAGYVYKTEYVQPLLTSVFGYEDKLNTYDQLQFRARPKKMGKSNSRFQRSEEFRLYDRMYVTNCFYAALGASAWNAPTLKLFGASLAKNEDITDILPNIDNLSADQKKLNTPQEEKYNPGELKNGSFAWLAKQVQDDQLNQKRDNSAASAVMNGSLAYEEGEDGVFARLLFLSLLALRRNGNEIFSGKVKDFFASSAIKLVALFQHAKFKHPKSSDQHNELAISTIAQNAVLRAAAQVAGSEETALLNLLGQLLPN